MQGQFVSFSSFFVAKTLRRAKQKAAGHNGRAQQGKEQIMGDEAPLPSAAVMAMPASETAGSAPVHRAAGG